MKKSFDQGKLLLNIIVQIWIIVPVLPLAYALYYHKNIPWQFILTNLKYAGLIIGLGLIILYFYHIYKTVYEEVE